MTNAEYVREILAHQFEISDDNIDQSEVIARMASIVQNLPSDRFKIVSVVGGAASGKSTFAEELVAFLRHAGIRADMLCTDNYAKGDKHYRQIELKDADAARKYDLELLDQHVEQIRQLRPGQTLRVPTIDKRTGLAADLPEHKYDYNIGPLDILIIEGDFPRDDYDLRFYIHVPDARRLENNIERETEHDDRLILAS